MTTLNSEIKLVVPSHQHTDSRYPLLLIFGPGRWHPLYLIQDFGIISDIPIVSILLSSLQVLLIFASVSLIVDSLLHSSHYLVQSLISSYLVYCSETLDAKLTTLPNTVTKANSINMFLSS